MVGFTILGGYLGAGKTTLLNHILRANNRQTEPLRIALLINDFGDINIDAELIESTSDNQINLANGCVCCTLTDGFTSALDTLLAMKPPPEHIILEASGVADVGNLSQYGSGQDLERPGVVVIADAETVRKKLSDKYVGRTILRQLKTGDLILLNKIDLLEAPDQQSLAVWLGEQVNETPIVPCRRCDVPLELITDLTPHAFKAAQPIQGHEHYAGWSYQSDMPVSVDALEAFAEQLGPDVLRCKGLFANKSGGVLELQVVGKRREIRAHDERHRNHSEMIAIGLSDQLDKKLLEAASDQLFGSEKPLN